MKSLLAVSIAMLVLVTDSSPAGPNQPKPPITITLAPETSTIHTGTAVFVRTVLANNSKQPLDASSCYCGPPGLDSLFSWKVRSDGHLTPKKVYPHPELATGSAILDRIVQPSGSLSGNHEISRLYDMTKPGKYVIQASREIPK